MQGRHDEALAAVNEIARLHGKEPVAVSCIESLAVTLQPCVRFFFVSIQRIQVIDQYGHQVFFRKLYPNSMGRI